jgi:hypothetical protein
MQFTVKNSGICNTENLRFTSGYFVKISLNLIIFKQGIINLTEME